MARILVVDDEMGIRELLSEILSDEGHSVVLAGNAAEARHARLSQQPDLVLLDIWMPDTDGITLLKEWAAGGLLTMPVIMMSGHGTIDTAVEATRIGALDFLEKPISLAKLLTAVKKGLQAAPAPRSTELSLAAFPRSAPLKDLKKRLEQMASGSRGILIRNRPGAGYAELCARSLQAPGKGWLDLGAQTALLESSLLEGARGGVWFVAELAHMSKTQQKNLGFAFERLEKFAAHLVVSTEKEPGELLAGGWDEVLLSRLGEAWLALPVLAELRDEIPEIAGQILDHLIASGQAPERRFATSALNALRGLPWQGGWQECRALVRSLALTALEEEISEEDVRRLAGHGAEPLAAHPALPLDLPLREAREAFERLYFEYHLQLDGGNMTRLAEKAGMERTHLYRKLKSLGLNAGKGRDA